MKAAKAACWPRYTSFFRKGGAGSKPNRNEMRLEIRSSSVLSVTPRDSSVFRWQIPGDQLNEVCLGREQAVGRAFCFLGGQQCRLGRGRPHSQGRQPASAHPIFPYGPRAWIRHYGHFLAKKCFRCVCLLLPWISGRHTHRAS